MEYESKEDVDLAFECAINGDETFLLWSERSDLIATFLQGRNFFPAIVAVPDRTI